MRHELRHATEQHLNDVKLNDMQLNVMQLNVMQLHEIVPWLRETDVSLRVAGRGVGAERWWKRFMAAEHTRPGPRE